MPLIEQDFIISTKRGYFTSGNSHVGEKPDLSDPTPQELLAFADFCKKIDIEIPELKWIVSYDVY